MDVISGEFTCNPETVVLSSFLAHRALVEAEGSSEPFPSRECIHTEHFTTSSRVSVPPEVCPHSLQFNQVQ